MLIIYSKFILQKQLDEGDPTGSGYISSMNLLFLQQRRYCHTYYVCLKCVTPTRVILLICNFFCIWIPLTERVKVKIAGLFYRLKLRTLFFQIIKILHVLWLSFIRYPIVQTSSGGVQFVEQGHLYKLCPATAGLKACWQLTGQWNSRLETGDIALFADGRILSAVKRAGLFYRLKSHTLFFSNY